jgi:hypothetical protein
MELEDGSRISKNRSSLVAVEREEKGIPKSVLAWRQVAIAGAFVAGYNLHFGQCPIWVSEMKRAGAHWHKVFLSRFADRKDIGKDKLYEQYFSHLPKKDVIEFFDLIEFEYEIPAGQLRPEDKVSKLFEPVKPRNVWHWLVYQVREGDSKIEVINELVKREKRYGTYEKWKIETIDDLIQCWCGQLPRNGKEVDI